jgi:formylglycine-generating enzyme required for sulfatase activity
LRGELDWIVLQAVDPERERRYPTPAALAADVRRHLAHEPISARPSSGLRVLRLLARRHRVAAGLAFAAVSAVVIGGSVTTWLRLAARASERRALVSLDAYDRLTAVVRLERAVAEQEALWPAEPAQATALRTWLRELGEPLVAELPLVRMRLARLVPGDGERERFLRDALGRLANDLERFCDPEGGRFASVSARLARAESVVRDTIERPAAEWARARAAVRARFGFDLPPQLGLVPLGPDPRSGLEEFVHIGSGTAPLRETSTGRLVPTAESGIVLVLLPGGTFWMGTDPDPSLPAEIWHSKDEAPRHQVTLAPFFLGKHEVTQAQWRRMTEGAVPSRFQAGQRPNANDTIEWTDPVENVSWFDCELWLGRHGLVLPTEAQWEYGCKGGLDARFGLGDAVETLRDHANVADARAARDGRQWACELTLDDGRVVHAPVGSYAQNGLGLCDMHGNVWEWCRDRYLPYSVPPRVGDGLRDAAAPAERVTRGGAFNYPVHDARAANRFPERPENLFMARGVRAARVLVVR